MKKDQRKKYLIPAGICILLLIGLCYYYFFTSFTGQGKVNYVYIDNDDVPQFLKDMDNPYDTTARSQEGAVAGQTARWDVAYYNGHYYVYFGIVPLLLMYLPFRLIFKAPFPTALGIAVFAILFSVGSYILLSFIAKKKFKGQSVGSFILVFLLFISM